MQFVGRLVVSWCVVLVACGPKAETRPPEGGGAQPPAVAPLQAGPLDGIACVGSVDAPPAGAEPLQDKAVAEDMFKRALGADGAGSLCTGQLFRATAAIKVYRVWNSEKDYTQFGSWWSFAPPTAPRERYREENAICEDWSLLDRLIVCDMKVGTNFVIGPGQSATCKVGPSYPKSATNQVFIPNDGRNDLIFVENCEQKGPWPE